MKIPDGHEFEYKQIRPCMINVDRTYQRDLDQNRVARIVKAFNPDVFNEPKVSYRNGQIMVEGATDDEVVLYDIMRRRLAM